MRPDRRSGPPGAESWPRISLSLCRFYGRIDSLLGHTVIRELHIWKSAPHSRAGHDSFLWTHGGSLRLTAVLTVLLAVHLLTTALVIGVHLTYHGGGPAVGALALEASQ